MTLARPRRGEALPQDSPARRATALRDPRGDSTGATGLPGPRSPCRAGWAPAAEASLPGRSRRAGGSGPATPGGGGSPQQAAACPTAAMAPVSPGRAPAGASVPRPGQGVVARPVPAMGVAGPVGRKGPVPGGGRCGDGSAAADSPPWHFLPGSGGKGRERQRRSPRNRGGGRARPLPSTTSGKDGLNSSGDGKGSGSGEIPPVRPAQQSPGPAGLRPRRWALSSAGMTPHRPAGPGSPPRRGALLQNVLAKALYDNVAESPDELSFRKGDIMTVLERNTQGLDGWWLCSLHGRQGIVPGNRLKILVGMYDKKQQQQAPGPAQGQAPPQPPVPQPALPYLHQGGYTPLSPASQYTPMHPAYAPQGDNVYLMPVPSKGQQGLYPGSAPTGQFPPALAKQPPTYPKQTPPHAFPSPGQEIYQVPPSLGQAAEAYPGGSASPPQDVYQVPPSAGQAQDIYQVPPSLDMRSWEGHKPQGKVGWGSRGGGVAAQLQGALWSMVPGLWGSGLSAHRCLLGSPCAGGVWTPGPTLPAGAGMPGGSLWWLRRPGWCGLPSSELAQRLALKSLSWALRRCCQGHGSHSWGGHGVLVTQELLRDAPWLDPVAMEVAVVPGTVLRCLLPPGSMGKGRQLMPACPSCAREPASACQLDLPVRQG